jgi:hypothetical protein
LATSWVLKYDPIDLTDWNASPFGTRLAELTRATAERVGAATRPASPHRPVWAQSTTATPQMRSAQPAATLAGQRREFAAAPSLERPSRGTAMRGARRVAARHEPRAPVTDITRAYLATLAGNMTPVLRAIAHRPRADLSPPRASPPQARTSAIAGAPKATRDVASADLHEHAIRRIATTLSRAYGRPLSAGHSWLAAADPIGWMRALGEPDPGLALIAPEAPVVPMAAPPRDRDSQRARQMPPEGPSPSILSGEPPPAPLTSGRASASPAGGEAAVLGGSDGDASTIIAMPFGPRRISAPESGESASAQALSQTGVRSARGVDRPRFDREEFAEHLRIALIDDARRLGIDV